MPRMMRVSCWRGVKFGPAKTKPRIAIVSTMMAVRAVPIYFFTINSLFLEANKALYAVRERKHHTFLR